MKKVPLVFLLMFAFACIRQSVKTDTNFAAGQPMPSPTAPSIAAAPTPLAKPTLYPLSCSAPLPKRVSQILLEIKELQKQGFEMQSLRDENDLQSAEKCSRLMKKYQTKARNLGEKSESLPAPYGSFLGLASIRMETCVTCGSDASENCRKVDEDIGDMNERVNSKNKK